MNNIDIKLPFILTLTKNEQKNALEALIFAADEPVSLQVLFNILAGKDESIKTDPQTGERIAFEQVSFEDLVQERFGFTKDFILQLISEINEDLETTERPYRIVDYAGGYQFSTIPKYGEFVKNLYKNKIKKKLSQASLEALAIIAYKQPITKPGIEQIRGVNSNEVVNTLIEKNFVRIVGRSDSLGKPLLYGTTNDFLVAFGLNSLNELPKLKELDDISEDMVDSAGKSIVELRVSDEDVERLKTMQNLSNESNFDLDTNSLIKNEISLN